VLQQKLTVMQQRKLALEQALTAHVLEQTGKQMPAWA